MKKNILLISLMIAITFLITGCSKSNLSENFDKEEVSDKAIKTVELLSAKDYESVELLFSEKLKEVLNKDNLEEALDDKITELGEFIEVKSQVIAGSSDKEIGDYAIVVIVCLYENGKAVS